MVGASEGFLVAGFFWLLVYSWPKIHFQPKTKFLGTVTCIWMEFHVSVSMCVYILLN